MADQYVAYVGSYTRGDSKGLHIFDFNPETLELRLIIHLLFIYLMTASFYTVTVMKVLRLSEL